MVSSLLVRDDSDVILQYFPLIYSYLHHKWLMNTKGCLFFVDIFSESFEVPYICCWFMQVYMWDAAFIRYTAITVKVPVNCKFLAICGFVRQKNLVGRRGLMPDSDQQTFRIAVQRQLRTEYDRILMPVISTQVSSNWCRVIYNVFFPHIFFLGGGIFVLAVLVCLYVCQKKCEGLGVL